MFSQYLGQVENIEHSTEGINWAHWVLVLLGPSAIIFWIAIGFYRTRMYSKNDVILQYNNHDNAKGIAGLCFERTILPLE